VPVLAVTTIQEEQLGDYPELADLMAEWAATGHMTLTVVPLERSPVLPYRAAARSARCLPASPCPSASPHQPPRFSRT